MGGDVEVPRRRGLARLPGLVAIALASLAILASSASGFSLIGPGVPGRGGKVVRFVARGSHGYKVSVYARVGPRSPVTITIENFKGGAQYVATGAVTATHLRASFGKYGRISMRFRPSGKVLRGNIQGDKQCPYGAAARIGSFIGTFRFTGEGGYTHVSLHRVAGGVGAPSAPIDKKEELALGCHQEQHLAEPVLPATPSLSPSPGEEQLPGGLYLYASASTATGTIHLATAPVLINGAPAKPPVTFVLALLQEEAEGVRIGRLALGGGRSSQILPDTGSLTDATLTPGSPFTGTATYAAGAAGTGTLTGDLAVPLLGAGVVALDGPTFQAELLRPQS